MELYKRIYAQPLITHKTVYRVNVYIPRKGKELKFQLTITDYEDDLLVCESFASMDEVKKRIGQLEFEFQLDDLI